MQLPSPSANPLARVHLPEEDVRAAPHGAKWIDEMPVNRGEYFPIEIQGLEVVTGMHMLFL